METITPVIFIPGIKGTKLLETNQTSHDTIWSGIQTEFESIEDLELSLPFQGEYFDAKLSSIIKPGEIEELAFGEFLSDLNVKAPIYIFNYDWRFSASHNAVKLKDFIQYIIKKGMAVNKEVKSFDFITHSLGNFILRAYLKSEGFERVNKIVFTAPPFQGSLDIALTVLVGEGFFPGVKAKIRKLIRTSPGALELLPIFSDAGNFAEDDKPVDFFNFEHWQKNILIKEPELAKKFIAALKRAKITVDSSLLDLKDLTKAQRDRILIIARNGYKTIQSMKVHKNHNNQLENYFDFRNALSNENGDGRVPLASSCCFWDSALTLVINDAFFYSDYSHAFFLKDERVQDLVNNFLATGEDFKYEIPGDSIKKVTGLTKNTVGEMPFWDVET